MQNPRQSIQKTLFSIIDDLPSDRKESAMTDFFNYFRQTLSSAAYFDRSNLSEKISELESLVAKCPVTKLTPLFMVVINGQADLIEPLLVGGFKQLAFLLTNAMLNFLSKFPNIQIAKLDDLYFCL